MKNFGFILLFIPLLIMGRTARAVENSDLLWLVVHDSCVVDQLTSHLPFPCRSVVLKPDIAHGFAVVADPEEKSQLLLVPTAKITGVEDPKILAADAQNYWSAAWSAAGFVGSRLHVILSRDQVGLAINPPAARSQNQLHIHIDCVDPSIRRVLASTHFESLWTPFTFRGMKFVARLIAGQELGSLNPFRLVATEILKTPDEMKNHGIALIGTVFASGQPGFYLVTNAPEQGPVGAEIFLDHTCRVLGAHQ